MIRLLLAGLLTFVALPAQAAPSLDAFIVKARAKTPLAMISPQSTAGDKIVLTFPAPGQARVEILRRLPDGTARQIATSFDLESVGAQVQVRMMTGPNGQMRPTLTCLAQLDSTGGALTGPCWPAALFETRGTTETGVKLFWTTGPQGSTIRIERGAQSMVALAPAPPSTAPSPPSAELSFRAQFTAALKAVSGYKVTDKPGVLIGDATAAGHTIPLVSVTVSDVGDGSFRLTRKMLFGPPEQKETRWDFRITGPGGSANELRYAVTQTQLSTAGQPRVATECLARRAASGAVSMQCLRPEVAALGPGIAQPSFTFAFRPWPLFEIDIGPGLDNIFTVKTESEFSTPRP